MAGTQTAAPQVISPWITVKEAAAYARRHPQTLYGALREYVQTGGKRGLRGAQNGAGRGWRVQRPDVDAWLTGEKPAGRLGRAS